MPVKLGSVDISDAVSFLDRLGERRNTVTAKSDIVVEDDYLLKVDPRDHTFNLYVDLMARCLIDLIYGKQRPIARRGKKVEFNEKARVQGREWPVVGHSMAGLKRLRNVAYLTDRAIQENVPGDFIETGVWRGGASAMIRGVLKARGVADRKVFLADSFEGLPPPNDEEFPADIGSKYHTRGRLAVGVEQVKKTFEAYGLMDEQVEFVVGWFKDTLHKLDVERFALLRLDGDMYESTIQAISALYPKLSPGGFIIVDDYGSIKACREAIQDYRAEHGIDDQIYKIDHSGVWWQKVR
jgi:O-methyltransferase